jgi:hypothetical protein
VKVNAYIMLADPAWIESSMMSYYFLVNKIVVTYDENSMSWSGTPLNIDSLIERIQKVDVLGKCEFVPGHFSRSEHYDDPMLNDTYQRSVSISRASEGADWIVQVDTDEIVPDFQLVLNLINEAELQECESIWFPQRWLYMYPYKYVGIEWCKRGGRRNSVYAGPIVIRSGTNVVLARRTAGKGLHVNRRESNVSPHADNFAVSHRQIEDDLCLLHMSQVRSYTAWMDKIRSWSHSRDVDYRSSRVFWLIAYFLPFIAVPVSHLLLKKGLIIPLRFTWIAPQLVELLSYNTRNGEHKIVKKQ